MMKHALSSYGLNHPILSYVLNHTISSYGPIWSESSYIVLCSESYYIPMVWIILYCPMVSIIQYRPMVLKILYRCIFWNILSFSLQQGSQTRGPGANWYFMAPYLTSRFSVSAARALLSNAQSGLPRFFMTCDRVTRCPGFAGTVPILSCVPNPESTWTEHTLLYSSPTRYACWNVTLHRWRWFFINSLLIQMLMDDILMQMFIYGLLKLMFTSRSEGKRCQQPQQL